MFLVRFEFGGESEVTEVTVGNWESKVKRRLTGINPFRAFPWLLSHLTAGVLAGVGEEVVEFEV